MMSDYRLRHLTSATVRLFRVHRKIRTSSFPALFMSNIYQSVNFKSCNYFLMSASQQFFCCCFWWWHVKVSSSASQAVLRNRRSQRSSVSLSYCGIRNSLSMLRHHNLWMLLALYYLLFQRISVKPLDAVSPNAVRRSHYLWLLVPHWQREYPRLWGVPSSTDNSTCSLWLSGLRESVK